ncbi:MAG TPA: EAL domain-containing protein [Thermoanaerobaculia bacterium]|jgi:diguanylate cyclase (GGDEF)-like protein/PAS domain S-box-containing protein|nr:EAL domain-containing protein [Thermoanaerobaculia bacterium]
MEPQHPFAVIPGGARDDRDELGRLRVEIEHRNQQETAIAELGQAALTGVDAMILLGQACALVELTLGVSHVRILEATPNGRMAVRGAIGADESFSRCACDAEEDESIGMFVYLAETPVTFSTSTDETRFKLSHLRDHHGVRSGAGIAIQTQYGPFGVLLIYGKEERTFRDFELGFLKSTANIVGEALARAHTETALRKSEQRLRQLIASALDAVVTIDSQTTILEWNPQAEVIFGFTARQMIGRTFPPSMLEERDFRMIQRLLARSRNAPKKSTVRRRIETIARGANGHPFPIEMTIEQVGSGSDQLFTAFIRDISERKRSQHELEQRERRFRTIFEKSWSGVALLDANLRFSFAASSTSNILGYNESDLVGQALLDFVHPRERAAAQRLFESLAATATKEAHGELRFRHKNGTWVWLEGFAQNLLHEPSVTAIVLNYRDVTQRRLTEKQLEYRAHYDALTGLPNRVLFRDRVVNGLAQAHRNHRGLAIMYLDLDHFKLVNDGLGHSFGDALLAAVASRLQQSLRSSDTISRIGGDEFAILINDATDSNAIASIARKLLDTLAQPFRIDDHDLYVTSSVGISIYPSDGADFETLVKCADAAMYRAKELGRNQAQLFTPSMNERYVHRLAIEQHLHQALERGELELYYQPIYDRIRRCIVSVEALLRWNDPQRGVVPPGEFISLAEETGLILPIGDWVIRSAAAQTRRWRDEGLGDLRVSFNISAHQLQQAEFISVLRDAIRSHEIDPHVLQIEITETAAMLNVDRTMRLLGDIREMGVTIAIDDFGTGQSSLIYLKQFPIDTIKIDKAFLRDITEDETAAALVSYVINLAHTLRLNVVAEGVETEGQYSFLRHYACDQMQGYLFSQPVPASEIARIVKDFIRPMTVEIPRPTAVDY